MSRFFLLKKGARPPSSTRAARPRVEALEDRKLLYATLGGNWVYGSRITYSFAPDGTNIGGASSNLNQAMASLGISTATWREQFEKAASVWEAVTNINLALVSDNGEAFGAPGNQQDDPNVGDIRIGGTALASNVLASTFLPPAFNGGTLAGDVVMNTSQAWHINSDYDLETVAIHEIGHALGMDHSQITTAAMYANYNAIKQSLTSDDVAGIQSVFGTRQPDPFNAGGASNASPTTAFDVTPYINVNNQVILPILSLGGATQQEWFKITIPSWKGGGMAVQMQSALLSELSPRVIVFDANLGNGVQALAANSYGATVTVNYTVQPNQVYYIRVLAANSGPTDSGTFGLQINIGGIPSWPYSPPNTTVAAQPDQGGGVGFLSGGSGGASGWGNPRRYDGGHGGDSQEAPIRVGNTTVWGDLLTIPDLGPGPDTSAPQAGPGETVPTAVPSAASGFVSLVALTGGFPHVSTFAGAGLTSQFPPDVETSSLGKLQAWDHVLGGG
jgi:hypothetical protein